jgi:hypothetical protein
MKERCLRLHENDLRAELLPNLIGRVFHVTTRQGYAGIRRRGSIGSNQDGKRPFSYPQSENSYFRKKGCVCLFDLRIPTAEQIDEALLKYYFLNPFSDNRPVFLILGEAGYAGLIPWSASIAEEGFHVVIHHVEAGYSGEIPMSLIDSALVVVVRKKSDLQKLREARRRRARDPNERIPIEAIRLYMRQPDLTEAEARELKEWESDIAALWPEAADAPKKD